MSNKKFLEKVAEVIISRSKDELRETVVVFPNKRPELFLKKYLGEKTNAGFWMPDIRSIDEFITELSPITPQDSMITWFELYEIHKKLEGDKARQPDEFISRASIMLNDFNDADLALTNIQELFTFLSKAKALERWHPDGSQLTEFEKSYIEFYQKLGHYYKQLKELLAEKDMGTKGMVYRNVAENIDKQEKLPWKHFIFAGFNALTAAEEKLIGTLRKNYPLTLLWDADEYYIYPKKHNLPWQEAGMPLKKLFKNLKIDNPQWVEKDLIEGRKKITFVAAPKQISQVKFVGQLMEQWNKEGATSSPTDTAIVLSDEKLLIPLLTSLSSGSLTYNVTMGFPLSLSQLAQLLTLWVELLVRQNQRNDKVFNTAITLSMLQNTVLRMLLNEPDATIARVKSLGSAFINTNGLKSCFPQEDSTIFSILFETNPTATALFNNMMLLLNLYKEDIDNHDKINNNNTLYNSNPMLRQQVASMMIALKKLSTILNNNKSFFNLKVFQQLFSKIIAGSEISLKGEPLNGVQIMGMLETRLLNFKKLIILSANEGHLPKTGSTESFIPFDIRSEYNLPLPDDKNAIFAYHFFRLLQQAEEVMLIYNSEVSDLGGGEKSRYLLQLEIEAAKANPNLILKELFLKVKPNHQPEAVSISIPKSEDTLLRFEEIGKKGFSPSALNQYISCPLKFYFSRILKLNPPNELRTTIEADVFGTIVHDVLEKIYVPDLNKTISTERLTKELKNLNFYLQESLKTNYKGSTIDYGKNLLITNVMLKYIKRFIQKDIENIRKEPRILLGTEQEIAYPLNLSNGKQILIKGFIDRIDRFGDEIRISDYKTGGVKKSDVNFKEWENLLSESKFSKAFQTLLYGWLFKKANPDKGPVKVGLFSLRNISEGYISPAIIKENPEAWHTDFEKILVQLLETIIDPEVPFVQTSDVNNCQYCDFKDVCNR